ncbi:Aldehyde oxidase GLOX1 [Linum perenne]
MIVIGGRGAQSFEYIPPEGTNNNKPFFFDFLQQTADPDENNLYPFVFLSPDKNVFVFANNRSVLLNPDTNTVEIVQAEVLICGGSAHINSYTLASKDMFYEGLQDCGRLIITRPRPNWRRELMPTSRIMGDMVLLPTGEVLIVNGAQRGSAEGKVLIAGSNTNNGYIYDAMYPTELRVEKFLPPYFDPKRANKKPKIIQDGCPKTIAYGQELTVKIELNEAKILLKNFKVSIYVPAFTTHGVAMNQRLIMLLVKDAVKVSEGRYDVKFMGPPNSAVAPTGYYMLSVVHNRLPTETAWVQLK